MTKPAVAECSCVLVEGAAKLAPPRRLSENLQLYPL
jgi:hypothetical protein